MDWWPSPNTRQTRLPLHPLFQWLKQTPIAARPSHFVGAYAATTSKTLFEVEVFTPHKAHIPAMNWEHVAKCCQLLPTLWVWVKTGTSRNPRYFGGFTMVPGLWPSTKPRTDPRDPRCGCEAQPFALNGWIRSTSSISKRWNGMHSQVKRHIWILKGYGSKLGHRTKECKCQIWWKYVDLMARVWPIPKHGVCFQNVSTQWQNFNNTHFKLQTAEPNQSPFRQSNHC